MEFFPHATKNQDIPWKVHIRQDWIANGLVFPPTITNTHTKKQAIKPFHNGCDFQIKCLVISSSYMFGNPIVTTIKCHTNLETIRCQNMSLFSEY